MANTFETLLREQLYRIKEDFDLVLVCNFTKNNSGQLGEQSIFLDSNIRTHNLPLTRKYSPLIDLLCLVKLVSFFNKERFHAAHSMTPKAGLLTMLAAKLSGLEIRIHTFTGQVWQDRSGIQRFILKFSDKITAHFATHVYADSNSQLQFLVGQGVVKREKISVIGNGSVAGVDTTRFTPSVIDPSERALIRKDHGIDEKTTLICFLGRVVRDKGIVELCEAIVRLNHMYDVKLLLIGHFDNSRGLLPDATLNIIQRHEAVIHVGRQDLPERYLAISEIFCIPSYREGFGTSAIEASSMGLPVVASNISGLRDAVQDTLTGILVEPKNVDDLARGIEMLVKNPVYGRRLGSKGRLRAIELFQSEAVNELVVNEYRRLI